MKILMLLDNEFPPDVRVEKEAETLIRQGHAVSILSYNFGRLMKSQTWRGIRIIRFKITKQFAKKSLGLSLQLPFYKWVWQIQVSEVLRSDEYDVVHIHDLPLCCLIQFIKRKYGIPVVADMHENYPHMLSEQPYMHTLFGRIFLSIEKWAEKESHWLSLTDHIVCVAEEMKHRIMGILTKPVPIVTLPNTADIESLKGMEEQEVDHPERFRNTFNLLYIGGLDPTRGLEVLIKAGKKLSAIIPELKIIIVGSGRILPELKQLSIQLDISEYFCFEGQQPSNLIGSYIKIAHACLIPHRKSPQTDNSSPNKLFQYLFFKKPVISSNCNSIEKIILAEKCGMIYPDNSPEELAARINYLYEHPEARTEMGNNGYGAVMNKYNWESTVAPLLAIYSDLSQRSTPAPPLGGQ